MTKDMFGIDCFRPFRAGVLALQNNRVLPFFDATAPLGHSLVQNNALINKMITCSFPLAKLFILQYKF